MAYRVCRPRLRNLAWVFASVMVVAVTIAAFAVLSPEVDDVAERGPLHSIPIAVTEKLPLLEHMLAAGISWDYDADRFFITTDHPHGLFSTKLATFYVVNHELDKVLYKLDLPTDGDLEGVAYIGSGEVAAISESGTLYYFRESAGNWQLDRQRTIFDADDAGDHKLGSLAYDVLNRQLYTAEKTGQKIIYRISREGLLNGSFELDADGLAAKHDFSFSRDYTISGMVFGDGHLYALSEAWSTVFKIEPLSQKVVSIYGINGIRESAGITRRRGEFWLVGDFEGYLPAPELYRFGLY